jgi:hypothetical protein
MNMISCVHNCSQAEADKPSKIAFLNQMILNWRFALERIN